jgi:hypothetical protein
VDHLYSLYDALISINVPNDRARAVVDAMERDMSDKLATKADLKHMHELISRDFQVVNARFDHLTHVLTVRLFLAAIGLIPIIVAAQKLL